MDEQHSNVGELIERARQGNAECRDQLFALCRNYLGFAARAQLESWLQVKVDASDLVQQTMLEAHRDF
ncbi:MAG: RNA polymerase factor sigma-70, partial [Thermoguttaceae bacterium]